jgi:hemerythrin-like metal-binding protein
VAELIVWKDRYSVGIEGMDQQHKKLVGLINELHDAMQAGRANEAVVKTLDGLVSYTLTHFGAEEALLKKSGYPGYEQQRSEHQKLVAQVKALQQKARAANLALSLEVSAFLRNWLIDHIVGVDKQYTAHLKAAGAA